MIETIEAEDWRTPADREARETPRASGRIPLLTRELKHNAFPGYTAQSYPACPPPVELSRWEERERLGLISDLGALT